MAVYISLISKYKLSQVEQFLVKQNAKLSPTRDHVSRASSQHRQFLDGRLDAEGGETALMASILPGGRDRLGRLLQASSSSLACWFCWSFSMRRVTLSLAYRPGCSGDTFVYVWVPEAELTATSAARSCCGSMMRSQELPVSQTCMVFYCSAARSSGKEAELTLSWVQSAALWYFLTVAAVPEEAAVAFSSSKPLLS